PPLRERLHDIPLLVRHFMEKFRLQFRRNCQEFDDRSMERLIQYPWPGNVRELKNVIERAMILCQSAVVHVEDSLLPFAVKDRDAMPPTQLKDMERAQILQALTACEWRIDGPLGAAKHLGLHPSTLRSRLKKFGINRPSE
ncbi:MAG: Fis family transcriptional regulator, partial [Nitrospirae bacterium CG_4_9_14_3_um_filter_51_5]